jgi:hypothetical protein
MTQRRPASEFLSGIRAATAHLLYGSSASPFGLVPPKIIWPSAVR